MTHFGVAADDKPTGFPQVFEELREVENASPEVFRFYTFGLSLLSQEQKVAGQWRYHTYLQDGRSNVRLLADDQGNVTDEYQYDAFGIILSGYGNTPNNFLFAGEQFDGDLDLYYLRARYLEPDRGRFWSMDKF